MEDSAAAEVAGSAVAGWEEVAAVGWACKVCLAHSGMSVRRAASNQTALDEAAAASAAAFAAASSALYVVFKGTATHNEKPSCSTAASMLVAAGLSPPCTVWCFVHAYLSTNRRASLCERTMP